MLEQGIKIIESESLFHLHGSNWVVLLNKGDKTLRVSSVLFTLLSRANFDRWFSSIKTIITLDSNFYDQPSILEKAME